MKVEPVIVLLIDSDQADVEAVKAAFGALGSELRLEVADRLATGLERLATSEAEIVLLDLNLPDSQGYETFEKTLRQSGGLPVIILSRLDDAELALRAVRAGAQDYLVKGRLSGPSLVRCVQHAVERHRHVTKLLSHGREKSGGKVVSFLGVKGGVGTTTVALNTAAALAQLGRKTIAVELWPFSSFSIHLRKPPALDLSGLLEMTPRRINSRAVEQKLVSVPFGFRALFAPPRGDGFREIQPEQASALIRGASGLAEFVVLDLPSQVSAAHQAAVLASNYVAIVLEPDPLSVEFAKLTVEMLEQWGLDQSAFGLVVVNRAALANSIRPPEMRNLTGGEIVGLIPPAGEACVLAFEARRLLVAAQSESNYAAAIREFTERLTQSPVGSLRF